MNDPLVEALFRALEDDPGDVASLCALADWFEEHERFTPARCLRWCVTRGRKPFLAKGIHFWGNGEPGNWSALPPGCRLPPALWRALRGEPASHPYRDGKAYATRRLAYEALIETFPLRFPGEPE